MYAIHLVNLFDVTEAALLKPPENFTPHSLIKNEGNPAKSCLESLLGVTEDFLGVGKFYISVFSIFLLLKIYITYINDINY